MSESKSITFVPHNGLIRRLSLAGALAVLVLGAQSATYASMLTVNLSGVDVRFKGSQTDIVDDNADAYDSSGNPSLADDLGAATLTNSTNNIEIEDWLDPADSIYADLLIEDGLATLGANTLETIPLGGGTNEFLWFVNDGTSLRLQFDNLSVQRTVTGVAGVPEIFIMTGSATVLSQNLPGGMAYQDKVGFAYVSTDAMFNVNESEGFGLTGVVTITGEMIPEPATLGLSGLALCSVVACGSRRRR